MPRPPYQVAHVSEIEPIETGLLEAEWKPVRHHFGIREFGVNVFVAAAPGDQVIDEHDDSERGSEELYYVASGRATFTVAGERVDAALGTFVFVGDPTVVRSAVAEEAGTTLIAFGAEGGAGFTVSSFERRFVGE